MAAANPEQGQPDPSNNNPGQITPGGAVPAAPLIGVPINRVDGRLKVTGGARYSAEFPVDRLAHGVLLQSTIAKGRIESVDISVAEKAPGVILVMTYLNAPGPPREESPGRRRRGRPLLSDEIQYNRENIGVVVAETLEQAIEAVSLVRFHYAAEKPSIEMLPEHPKVPPVGGQLMAMGSPPADSSRGDLAAGMAAAAVTHQATYTSPMESHNPMEPHATTAVWDGDHLTLHDSTQGIFGVVRTVAGELGIPAANIRVITYFVGGGFGCKGTAWTHVALTAMAARMANCPVRLALQRSQMYGPVGYRPEISQDVTLAADKTGKLTAARHDSVNNTSQFDGFVERAALTTRSLYECPNVVTSHRLVRLDVGAPTFMRAPGELTGSWALESAMDELAWKLGMDPIELRLRNYAETDPENGHPWTSKSLRECYQQGAAKFGWSRRAAKPGVMKANGMLVGWGMATASYPTHRSGASALARIFADGTALVQAGSQDIGTGTYTVMTQVAAEALGLPVEKVHFELGDTNMPETPGSGGSQTAASAGSAVHAAAADARDKMIAMAIQDKESPLFGKASAEIGVNGGRLFVKAAPATGETYQAILKREKLPSLEARADSRPGEESRGYSAKAFGAQFAEVQVDPALGQIRVSRRVGAFAAGRMLNAKTARSQLMGGIVWGIGMGLMEHTVVDPFFGRVLNADLAEYHVPVNADVPEVDVIMVEEEDQHVNPIGVKGIGEIGITGCAAAIANAVYHATGKRIRDLPITLDKVMA